MGSEAGKVTRTNLPDAKALSKPAEWWVVGTEILRDAAQVLGRKTRRSRDRVSRDYDQGVWKSVLDRKEWRRAETLEDYLTPDDGVVRTAKIDHRLMRITTSGYYRYRNRLIQSVLEEFAADATEVIELGCGTGFNLFVLALSGRWKSLTGFDISANAVRAAREIAAYFDIRSVSFDQLDLTDPLDPAFKRLRGKTIFTYYCLEQLKYGARTVIDNLILAGVKRAIHFETSTELLNPLSLKDWANHLYIVRQDYLDDPLAILRDRQAKGTVRLVAARRPGYAPSPKNDPLLVVWDRREESLARHPPPDRSQS